MSVPSNPRDSSQQREPVIPTNNAHPWPRTSLEVHEQFTSRGDGSIRSLPFSVRVTRFKRTNPQTVLTPDNVAAEAGSTLEVSREAHGLQADAHSSTVEFALLLPPTYRHASSERTVPDQIRTVDGSTMRDFLQQELSIPKLDATSDTLSLAGEKAPPRPLWWSTMTERSIVVVEDINLHLTHSANLIPKPANRLFLKPLPTWLLDPDLWATYLQPDRDLFACALGFLSTYTALVCHPSDFDIAKREGLLPHDVKWEDWASLVAQVVQGMNYESIHPRYLYGELDLRALNSMSRGAAIRSKRTGFFPDLTNRKLPPQSSLRVIFTLLGSAFAVIAVALSALQVGAGTSLNDNETFQSASSGFTIFSLIFCLLSIFIAITATYVSAWGESFKDVRAYYYTWRARMGRPRWRREREHRARTKRAVSP